MMLALSGPEDWVLWLVLPVAVLATVVLALVLLRAATWRRRRQSDRAVLVAEALARGRAKQAHIPASGARGRHGSRSRSPHTARRRS